MITPIKTSTEIGTLRLTKSCPATRLWLPGGFDMATSLASPPHRTPPSSC